MYNFSLFHLAVFSVLAKNSQMRGCFILYVEVVFHSQTLTTRCQEVADVWDKTSINHILRCLDESKVSTSMDHLKSLSELDGVLNFMS